ncbi:MAG: FGGY family carbohydrate kinase [Gammaproteobacteria bacterium]|nr:FGGY family carbohydrate kinase [Gammaproteobacteria bacterium]
MKGPYYLAVDQGGHGTRALVFDEGGVVVARALVPVGGAPGGRVVEQDAETVVESVRTAITWALAAEPRLADGIVAAGLATQRSSLVCWDTRTGGALTPVIGWQDRRAAELMPRYQDHAFAVRERTGLVLSPHYGALKMRWCLEQIPAVRAAARGGYLAMGPLASFLAYRLVEPRRLRADPANASRTLLWNRHTRSWDHELLALFDIPEQVLPDCTPSRYPFGALVTKELSVPLAILTGDQSAALFAEGAPRPDTVYLNMGTGAFLQRPVGHALPDNDTLLWSTALLDGHESVQVAEGTVHGAGAALDWAAAHLGYAGLADQCGRLLGETGPRPLFVNAVGGLGSPYWRADIESRFEGEGSTQDKAAAVFESIVFLIMENLLAISTASGPFTTILATGGLTACDALCQALADLAHTAVRRPLEREGTARGLAYLVAGGPRSWPRTGGDVFPPQPREGMAARFAAWRTLMPPAMRA